MVKRQQLALCRFALAGSLVFMPVANSEGSLASDNSSPGVQLLRDLWHSELDILLATIANGRRNHEEIHRSAQHVSSDYHERFLIELIQNANDQARLASLETSTVKILRTDRFVAVSNEGQPFDGQKLQEVTSIFLSDKPPDLCIGNKGIGFKAVFEIAEEAEIYSAANGANLAENCSLAFRIVREPIADPGLRAEFTRIVQELLDRNPDRAEALRKLRPDVAPLDQMLSEAAKAAWFKFPLPADHGRLIAHLEEAGVGRAFLQQCQTMVLLPVRSTARSQQTVTSAVSEIVSKIDATAESSTKAAAAMLFLDGITRLEVSDRVTGIAATIERHPSTEREQLDGGVVLDRYVITQQQITRRAESEKSSAQMLASHWWVARRTLGEPAGNDHTRAEIEQKAIRAAIATLDLPTNWQDVARATVSVAISVPSDEAASCNDWCSQLSANGHFCIGLPTKVATGTPFWIDGHFHGSIARTEIEFEKNDYNVLLLDSALGLVSALVSQLKADDRIGIKRCVTLAMRRTSGRLADMLCTPGGVATSEVVLEENGRDFTRAIDLRMPRPEDLEVFREMVSGIGDVSAYGLCLPDFKLLESARDLIDALAGEAPVDVEYIIYTRRPGGSGLSLVEEAARRNRHSGPNFWSGFLKWLLDRFQTIEPLLDQKILPVGRDELETSSARVFLPPMPVTSSDRGAQDARPAAVGDEEETELEAIDDDIAERLRFLDDQAVELRTDKASERSKLARRLAPNVGEGLVRQPRRADLINYALAPALKRSVSQRDAALRLLRQALEWLMLMNPTTQRRVRIGELLVPISSPDGKDWEWIAPDLAYLGSGWQDGPSDALLTAAYGPARQLVSWPEFERETMRVFRETERKWWVAGMRRLGVEATPRIVCARQNVSPFESRNYQLCSKAGVACPLPQAAAWWSGWLNSIHSLKASADWGRQDYFLSEVSWIDGMEDDGRRTLVFELMLRNAHHYLPHLQTELARSKGGDSRDVPAFWMHVLCTEAWELIPTNKGLRRRDTAFWLETDQRDQFSHLPAVLPEFGAARELLGRLGVVSLEESTPSRLVEALHSLAEILPSLAPERLKSATVQAADLYARIDLRLGTQQPASSIANLGVRPIPLEHNRRIEAVTLANVGQLLVDDDPLRRQHLAARDEEWSIPRSRRDLTHLTQALRELIGADKVICVSELPTAIEFTQTDESVLLLQYLRENFPEHPVDVDLALLIIVQGTSISGEHFKRLWSIVSRTQLRQGKFADGFALNSWFDQRGEGGPTLMVDSNIGRCGVVGEVWRLIGPAYRDIWGNYASVLRLDPRQTVMFFAERGATESDRIEAEARIDRNFERRFSEFQGVVLALWRRSPGRESLERFHNEWKVQARSVRAMSDWVGTGNLGELLLAAEQRGEIAGILALLDAHGLSVEEWQQARKDLGQTPYPFAESVRLFGVACDAVATRIMAWVAFIIARATPGRPETFAEADIASLREWVEALRLGAAPTEVRERPLDEKSAVAAAARHALSIADTKLARTSVLAEAKGLLASLAKQPQASIKDIQLAKERSREAAVYLEPPDVRAAQAQQMVRGILRVATELASKLGESLDSGKVEVDARVAFLSHGWWANRYSVLAALSRAVFAFAPKTAERMRENKAFHDLENWRALWLKFEELGPPPVEASPQAQPELNLFGLTLSPNDFAQRATEIAQRMDQNADNALDLASLLQGDRSRVQLPQPRKRGRRGGGGGGGAASKEEREIYGAMGEWFVYRQLRSQFDDFDATAWCSKAKRMFGFEDDGDDRLGYDFKYRDSTGKLTGRCESLLCHIEVKSTTGDGLQPFEMSANEWDVAQEFHADPTSGLYVIIRVAQITTSPGIADVLVDPVRLYALGQLTYAKRDLLIYVGNRQ